MTLLYIRFITLVKRFLISLFSQLIVPNLLQYSMMLDLYIVVYCCFSTLCYTDLYDP